MDLRDLTVLREVLLPAVTGPLAGLVLTTGLVTVVVMVVSGRVARSVVRSVPPGASVTARFGFRGVQSVAVVRSGGDPPSGGGGDEGGGGDDDRPVPESLAEYVAQEQEALMAAVRAYCFGLGLPSHHADDVFQEACYGLARMWQGTTWESRRHLDRCARKIIKRRALDMRYPKRGNDRLNADAVRLDHTELDVRPECDGCGPDDDALGALQAAVAALPDRQREIVIRVELLRDSVAEAAEDLGMTQVAVRKNLSRARRTLRKALSTYFEGVRDGG